MPVSETRARVCSFLLDFARDEWAQMGVFIAGGRRDTWAQDPEALLLFSLEIGRDYARFFDELLDWLRANGDSVSGRRLAALARHDPALQIVGAAVEWAARRARGAVPQRRRARPLGPDLPVARPPQAPDLTEREVGGAEPRAADQPRVQAEAALRRQRASRDRALPAHDGCAERDRPRDLGRGSLNEAQGKVIIDQHT